jgi:hypothetical protein
MFRFLVIDGKVEVIFIIGNVNVIVLTAFSLVFAIQQDNKSMRGYFTGKNTRVKKNYNQILIFSIDAL